MKLNLFNYLFALLFLLSTSLIISLFFFEFFNMEFKKNYLFNIFLKLGTVKIGLISLGLLFLSIFTLFLKKNLISLKFDSAARTYYKVLKT